MDLEELNTELNTGKEQYGIFHIKDLENFVCDNYNCKKMQKNLTQHIKDLMYEHYKKEDKELCKYIMKINSKCNWKEMLLKKFLNV